MISAATPSLARSLPVAMSRGLSALAPARPARLRLERPALSLCFDGFTRSAGELGARILDRHGVRGTFFASAGLIGGDGEGDAYFDPDLMNALADGGHEIGDASFSHRDLTMVNDREALDDIERNAATLTALGVKRAIRAFAYPFGKTRLPLKSKLPARIACARGQTPGLNTAWTDLMDLRAFRIADAQTFLPINAALDRARRMRAWLIVYTQSVSDRASEHSVTPATLEALIHVAKQAGFDIQPLGAVAERADVSRAAWA